VSAPDAVLLARALYFLELSQLQLSAGKYVEAAENIEKGMKILKEVAVR
jgi:hypothetical protein